MSRRRVDEELTPEQGRLAPLVDEVVGGRPATSGPASWARLAEAAARRRARRSATRWLRLVPAAAAVLAAAILGAHLTGRRLGPAPGIEAPAEPLGYAIDDRPAPAGGYVQGAGGTGTSVRFSDGTRLVFRPSATGRIVSSTPLGARVVLEEGAVRVDVVPRANARWSIEAGPYVVEVKGTRFELAWSRARARLEVELHEGQVEVAGPRLGTGVSVRAGERLQVDADGLLRAPSSGLAPSASSAPARPPAVGAEWRTPPAHSPPAPAERPSSAPPARPSRRGAWRAAAAPAAAPSAAPAADEASGGGGGAPSAAVLRAPPAGPALLPPPMDAGASHGAWADLVSRGAFRDVLDAVERLGVETCLSTCPVPDLVAAADAARYSARWALAERALHAVRRRAAGEGTATTAAFFLARLLAQRGDRAEALAWFARYEQEAPSGPYAALALGHRMALAAELGDSPTARELARVYLERHPEGAHATQARRLAEGR